jgi:hypothetical protein
MFQIQNLTDDTRQKQTLVLPDGTQIQISIYFVPLQLGWFITKLQYGDFVLTGFRIFNSPNMLHQYRNILPFGLACLSTAQREPSQQQDFSSGASKLFVIDQSEVAYYAQVVSGQV